MPPKADLPPIPSLPIGPAGNQTVLTSIEELLDAGRATGDILTPPKPFAPFVVIPDRHRIAEIPRVTLPPLADHIRQITRLDDAESFILYVKSFRTHTTRVFASAVKLADISAQSAGGAQFTALLDFHQGGNEQQAARVAHIAHYPVPLSLEFSTWMGMNEKPQPQMDFVTFIETNAVDVVSPDAATLMEIALNFESKSSVNFQSKVTRLNGSKTLTFQEAVEAGAPAIGQMTVPEFLKLKMPVFEGGKAYEFTARLEYRPSNGRLFIIFYLQRPHQVFRQALIEMRAEIAEALTLEILTGEVDVDGLRKEQTAI